VVGYLVRRVRNAEVPADLTAETPRARPPQRRLTSSFRAPRPRRRLISRRFALAAPTLAADNPGGPRVDLGDRITVPLHRGERGDARPTIGLPTGEPTVPARIRLAALQGIDRGGVEALAENSSYVATPPAVVTAHRAAPALARNGLQPGNSTPCPLSLGSRTSATPAWAYPSRRCRVCIQSCQV